MHKIHMSSSKWRTGSEALQFYILHSRWFIHECFAFRMLENLVDRFKFQNKPLMIHNSRTVYIFLKQFLSLTISKSLLNNFWIVIIRYQMAFRKKDLCSEQKTITTLWNFINLFTLMYADDMVLFSISNHIKWLQNLSDKFNEYCIALKLSVNVAKSKIGIFRRDFQREKSRNCQQFYLYRYRFQF